MPKVTVIVPIYNVERYIGKCLKSLQNQTLRDIEVICVDDCSTDSSVEVVERFIKDDKRFILLKNNVNSGAAIARNNGMDVACGEYIYFMDSDDWIDENYLEKMVEAIEISCCEIILNINIINEFSDKAVPYIHPTFPKVSENGEILDRIQALTDTPWHIWARLYKKSFLDKFNLRFIDIKACNDFVFHYITHIYIEKLFVFNGPGYHYISRNDSITGVTKKINNRDLYVIKAYSFIYDYFKKHNLLNKSSVKMFSVWPFFMVDSEDKYNFYKSFFEKINTEHFVPEIQLYNELECFFANAILSSKDFENYKMSYGTNVALSFMRRKKNV